MSEYVDLFELSRSDPEFSALIKASGLEYAEPSLYLEVRRLTVTRAFSLFTEQDDGDFNFRVGGSSGQLHGHALIREDFWGGRLQLGVWDGNEGAHVRDDVEVHLFVESPTETAGQSLSLGSVPILRFDSNAYTWGLWVPLPESNFDDLYKWVASGSVTKVTLHVDVADMFELGRDSAAPEREATVYLALDRGFVAGREIRDSTDLGPVAYMPCSTVRVVIEDGLFESPTFVEAQEKSSLSSGSLWEPVQPVRASFEELALDALQGVRTTLRLIAIALFLVFVAMLV